MIFGTAYCMRCALDVNDGLGEMFKEIMVVINGVGESIQAMWNSESPLTPNPKGYE